MKTVFISGAFNLLHAGHIQFFKDARQLGNKLIVAIPDSETLWKLYRMKSAMTDQDKMAVLSSLDTIDKVIFCQGDKKGLEFENEISIYKPDILAVTTDDQYANAKKELCARLGIEYIMLEKTPPFSNQLSCTQIIQKIKAPNYVPLRVDFAGGWLDVPENKIDGAYIVNCAISPTVSMNEWLYRKGAGLGGSGGWSVLNGWDPVKSELGLGVGWQDPAVIAETGACVWLSGDYPKLDCKNTGDFLQGRMAVLDTCIEHNTPSLANVQRNFEQIAQAGRVARIGVIAKDVFIVSEAVQMSYKLQLDEGMLPLPEIKDALGYKYCGGGHGGYALYLFADSEKRQNALDSNPHLYPIEPYCRTFGRDEPVDWEPKYRQRLIDNGVM